MERIEEKIDMNEVGAWPKGIHAITLFVEDLAAAKVFYREVFGLPVVFETDDSAVFRFGATLVNLLQVKEAPELIGPAGVAPKEAGSRFQFTIEVDDVDAMCAELKRRGGSPERSHGSPGAFGRPASAIRGHIWEIAK
jgi:catechol 2,3-dioxygenase-like lactoylglutathione lyase family enzyme